MVRGSAGRWLLVAALLSVLLSVLLGAGGCDRKVAGGKADGASVFSEVCARCHGPHGVPYPSMVARLGVKPLVSDHVQEEMTDADIRHQILNGSENKQMPSFQGALSDAQITAVIRYVRTLAKPK